MLNLASHSKNAFITSALSATPSSTLPHFASLHHILSHFPNSSTLHPLGLFVRSLVYLMIEHAIEGDFEKMSLNGMSEEPYITFPAGDLATCSVV